MTFQNFIIDLLRISPKKFISYLAGPPIIIDGNVLDPNMQIISNLNPKEKQKKLSSAEDYRRAAKNLDKIVFVEFELFALEMNSSLHALIVGCIFEPETTAYYIRDHLKCCINIY